MIITQTPLRISFAGGGTDFPDYFRRHGGCVVSSAIDKYVYTIVKERFDKQIYISYSKKEIVDSVDDIQHELVREAMIKTGVENGIEIAFLSDIPAAGSGLGSSSSVTVGVLNALYQYRGLTVSAEQLAEEACEIEIGVLKKPIGIQDQYIAAFGGLRFFEFRRDGSVFHERINSDPRLLEDLDTHLMLFFTGKTRQSSTILQEQKERVEDNVPILQKMAGQAKSANASLEKGRSREIGWLLHEGWELKRKLAQTITDPWIDEMYFKAREAGAIGGKIAGAGGGGFLLLFVPPANRCEVRAALSELQEMPFHLERDGSKVIFNIRR